MTSASPPPLFSLHSIHSGLLLFHRYTERIADSETLTLLCPLPVMFFSSDMPKACYSLAFLRSLFRVVFLLWSNTCNSLPSPPPHHHQVTWPRFILPSSLQRVGRFSIHRKPALNRMSGLLYSFMKWKLFYYFFLITVTPSSLVRTLLGVNKTSTIMAKQYLQGFLCPTVSTDIKPV